MRRFTSGLALLACCLTSPAWALSCTTTNCTFTVTYTEPTANTDNSPETTLQSTTITYTIAPDNGAPGAPIVVVVAASSPNGGGVINQPITSTTLVPGHAYTIAGTITATNTAGMGSGTSATPLTFQEQGITAQGQGGKRRHGRP